MHTFSTFSCSIFRAVSVFFIISNIYSTPAHSMSPETMFEVGLEPTEENAYAPLQNISLDQMAEFTLQPATQRTKVIKHSTQLWEYHGFYDRDGISNLTSFYINHLDVTNEESPRFWGGASLQSIFAESEQALNIFLQAGAEKIKEMQGNANLRLGAVLSTALLDKGYGSIAVYDSRLGGQLGLFAAISKNVSSTTQLHYAVKLDEFIYGNVDFTRINLAGKAFYSIQNNLSLFGGLHYNRILLYRIDQGDGKEKLDHLDPAFLDPSVGIKKALGGAKSFVTSIHYSILAESSEQWSINARYELEF